MGSQMIECAIADVIRKCLHGCSMQFDILLF